MNDNIYLYYYLYTQCIYIIGIYLWLIPCVEALDSLSPCARQEFYLSMHDCVSA